MKQIFEDKVFPIARGMNMTIRMDLAMPVLAKQSHEGIDIMCDRGVPVVSVCDRVVEKKGWLELGGWRLGIRSDDGIYITMLISPVSRGY